MVPPVNQIANMPGDESSVRPSRPERRTGAADERTPGWPPKAPRIAIVTCMKDEGPFILEWLAWHKSIGVTDVAVFTNDCTDGTDRLLDRLDAMGEVVHLPNPASLMGSTYFQPTALKYFQQLPLYRAADFLISIDVDEFIHIRAGDGTLAALFAAVPPFDVLSFNEVNHGSNQREHFERGWVTEQFPRHARLRPGKWKARNGVKSITRLGARVAQIRNHRPDLVAGLRDPVWLDGSGQTVSELLEDATLNGLDCRGRYDLVSLEHFALRSLDSYLVKMFRGDVVNSGKSVSQRYWRRRNRNEDQEIDLSNAIERARKVHERFEADAELMVLHYACCSAHEARIEDLRASQEFSERRDWVLHECW